MKTPTLRQRIAYDVGRELPEELHEWVVQDIVGRGALERYLVRFLWPIIPFIALVLLFPGPMVIKVGLVALMFVPMVVFAVALSYVWRRYRLIQHGLDPGRLDKIRLSEHDRALYELRYRHRDRAFRETTTPIRTSGDAERPEPVQRPDATRVER